MPLDLPDLLAADFAAENRSDTEGHEHIFGIEGDRISSLEIR